MKINTKKALVLVVVSLVSINSIFANFELWIGTGLIGHTVHLDESEKDSFQTMPQNLNKVTYIGPALDFNVIPYNIIPIGFNITTQIIFPVGYNDGSFFRSYNFDFKNRNMISLSYNKSFNSNWGIFCDLGYEFDYYRNSKTNYQNSKETREYNELINNGLYGDFGFLVVTDNGYFKFGIDYYHSLISKSFSTDLIFSGGVRF